MINKKEKDQEHLKKRNLRNIDLFYFNYIYFLLLIYFWISNKMRRNRIGTKQADLWACIFYIFYIGDVEDIS